MADPEALPVAPQESSQMPSAGAEGSALPQIDLSAELARLQAENRALQGAKDRETATERKARQHAETQLQTLRSQYQALEQQHGFVQQGALDAMNSDQLRDYAARMEAQSRQSAQREQQGLALFQRGDQVVSQLGVTDDEWNRHFDPSLADPGFWRLNPTEAQARLDRSLAALQGARGERAAVKSTIDRELTRREEERAHERRNQAAAAGALTPDRARGASGGGAAPWQKPDDAWQGADADFDPDMAALRQAANLTAGKRGR